MEGGRSVNPPVHAGGIERGRPYSAMALSRTAPALPNAGRAALPHRRHEILRRTGRSLEVARPVLVCGVGLAPCSEQPPHEAQPPQSAQEHVAFARRPTHWPSLRCGSAHCLRPTRGRDRLLPTGSSARPPLRRVSPAAVPWRLECRHDASTERPRQATCPRQEGGSAPAPRCRRWLRRGRRDGELASPVRASRLARRPDCGRPVGNALLARAAGTDLRRCRRAVTCFASRPLSDAPWRRR